ncbi:hypothetical protein [Alkaliphilus sp. B6464]|nr:hypothetical protein [Alkaliphilus sp. B6464]QUH21233.1 hypothetical protein HYG84_15990 [Alkaliphilus sp. B6464]
MDHIYIPDRSSTWKTIRAGYEIINMSSNIDESLKKDLKVILFAKGALIP